MGLTSLEVEREPNYEGSKSSARVPRLTRVQILFIPPLENSTLIPPTGLSLSEDVDTTPGFILTAYDLDPRVLRGCYDGVEVSQESREK